MSLRLDPKYHGVRVAHVRPKYYALSGPQMEPFPKDGGATKYMNVRFLRVRNGAALRFVRGYNKLNGKVIWIPAPGICASIDNTLYWDFKEALEALGLR